MAIVTVGNVPLQVPKKGAPDFVWQLIEQIRSTNLEIASRMLPQGERLRIIESGTQGRSQVSFWRNIARKKVFQPSF